jgi:hypothetical protein
LVRERVVVLAEVRERERGVAVRCELFRGAVGAPAAGPVEFYHARVWAVARWEVERADEAVALDGSCFDVAVVEDARDGAGHFRVVRGRTEGDVDVLEAAESRERRVRVAGHRPQPPHRFDAVVTPSVGRVLGTVDVAVAVGGERRFRGPLDAVGIFERRYERYLLAGFRARDANSNWFVVRTGVAGLDVERSVVGFGRTSC